MTRRFHGGLSWQNIAVTTHLRHFHTQIQEQLEAIIIREIGPIFNGYLHVEADNLWPDANGQVISCN
jgi:hypothetical protein